MKKNIATLVFLLSIAICNAQHLYDYTFPTVDSQNPKVVEMLENVNTYQISADVNHLTSYINRRCDGSHIYDVKNWLVEKFLSIRILLIVVPFFIASKT